MGLLGPVPGQLFNWHIWAKTEWIPVEPLLPVSTLCPPLPCPPRGHDPCPICFLPPQITFSGRGLGAASLWPNCCLQGGVPKCAAMCPIVLQGNIVLVRIGLADKYLTVQSAACPLSPIYFNKTYSQEWFPTWGCHDPPGQQEPVTPPFRMMWGDVRIVETAPPGLHCCHKKGVGFFFKYGPLEDAVSPWSLKGF